MSAATPPPVHREGGLIRTGWPMVLLWVAGHALMLWLWIAVSYYVCGDVAYYDQQLELVHFIGASQTLVEYPLPVVWGLWLLRRLAPDGAAFLWLFLAAMCVLDALFAVLLWRRGGPRRTQATLFWLAAVPALGPLLFFRFDLLPAVLAGAALLWLGRHPRVSGALTALGAAIKLWPALLAAPLLAARRGRQRFAIAFLIVGPGLALASLLAGGWDRLVSPLGWQSARGLQIESIAATPSMVARTFTTLPYTVELTQFNAFEITGPGTYAALKASTALTALGLLVMAVLIARLWLARAVHREAIGLLVLAIVAIMIVTNKTLSPQYLVWLSGPLAVLIGQGDAGVPGGPGPREIRRLGWAVLAICLLTQLIFPIFYGDITGTPRGSYFTTLLLLARNAGLLALTAWLCVAAWRAAGPTRPLREWVTRHPQPAAEPLPTREK